MEHASEVPITVPPKRASASPMIVAWVSFSFNNIGDNNATHNGPVETKTTELATDVYSRDEIHVAKCAARNIPEAMPNPISRLVRFFNSLRCRVNAMGAINSVANVNRSAAITSDGAPDCAKRIKIEAVETANMAMVRLMGRKTRCLSMPDCNHETKRWGCQDV